MPHFCALRRTFVPVKSLSKVGRRARKLGVRVQNHLWNRPQVSYQRARTTKTQTYTTFSVEHLCPMPCAPVSQKAYPTPPCVTSFMNVPLVVSTFQVIFIVPDLINKSQKYPWFESFNCWVVQSFHRHFIFFTFQNFTSLYRQDLNNGHSGHG